MSTKKDNKILIYLSVGLAVILLAVGAYFLRGTWYKTDLLPVPGTLIRPADNYGVGIRTEVSTYNAVPGTSFMVKLFTQGASATTPFNGVQLYLMVPSYLTPTSVTSTDPNMTAKPPRNMGNGVWQILLYGGNQTADMTSGFATVTFSVNGTVTAANVQIVSQGTTISNLTGDQNTNVHPFNTSTLFSVEPTPSVTYYTVTASVTGGHGTAVPATQTVNAGGSASITITPDNGYHLATLTDNTVAVNISTLSSSSEDNNMTSSLIYTISNIQANHAVVATFAPNSNSNTNSSNGNNNGTNTNTNGTNSNVNSGNGNNNGTNTNTNSSGNKCADTNNDLQYDACSLNGNGPTCTTAASCTYIPTGVTATADPHSQNVFVRWNPLNVAISSPNDPQGLNGYKVYRSATCMPGQDPNTCTDWVEVGQTNGAVVYVDTTGTPGASYVYAVSSIVAQVTSGKSMPSNRVTIGTNGSGSISSNMLILPFATKAPYHLTAGGVGANITWTSSNSGLVQVTSNSDGSADITVINSGSGMPAGNVHGGVSFITASGSTGYATMLVVVWPRGDTDGNFVVGPVDQNNVANGWSLH
jgi:hypothetical protein